MKALMDEIDKYKYRVSNGIPVLDYSKDKPLYVDGVAHPQPDFPLPEFAPLSIDERAKALMDDLQDTAQRIMDAYGIPRDFVGESATFYHPEPPPRHIPGVDLTPEPEKTIDLKYDEDQDTYRE